MMARPADLTRPFFEGPPHDKRRQRLLLISYHFPPGQAAGALRWEKLVGFAAERGWGVDVITVDPSSLPVADMSRLERLPAGVRLFGVREQPHWIEKVEHAAWRLYRLVRSLRRTTGAAAAPGAGSSAPLTGRADSRSREELKAQRGFDGRSAFYAWLDYARQGSWALRAAELGAAIVQPGTHRAIVTCGPPHMVHDGGRILSERTGLPLVVDMRDPWSLVQRLAGAIASPVWLDLAEKYERLAVERASLLVTNTEAVRSAMQRTYPEAAAKMVAVMNGYDEERLPHAGNGSRFLIAYAGTVYLDRDPRPLFAAAARVISEFALSPSEFAIEFMGHAETYGGLPLPAIAAAEGVGEFVRMRPPASREKALEFLSTGTVLVSLPQDSDMAIPSKVFEYMQYEAWVLALADGDSATASVLQQTSADVVAPNDIEALTAVLRRRFLQHRAGERPQPIVSDDRFSRRAQAGVLFDRLEAILSPGSASGSIAGEARAAAGYATTHAS